MAENDRRPHLLILGSASTERFTSPRQQGPESQIPPRDRAQHGQRLLGQLVQARQEADAALQQQHAIGIDVGNGIFLEFESEPGFQLPTESLEDVRKRIELMSVKERDNRTFATVFVPEGRLDHFERRVSEYLHQETPTGKPKNERLITQLQNIRLAAVEALWTDEPALLPAENEAAWWEVWLRVDSDRQAVLGFFREYATHLGLEVSGRHVAFPERTVVNVRGTKAQLAQSVQLLNSIAELRKPKDTAAFFAALEPSEQRDWMNELLGRIQLPSDHAPVVCLLDTGVNRGHPLVSPLLGPTDLDTVNPAWGVDDQYGHGTQMAGLATHGDLVEALQSDGPVEINHRLESVKLLQQPGTNAGELHGDLTAEAVARAEIIGPHRRRTICMAVSSTDGRDRGRPSTWSAAVDSLAAGAQDETPRLFVLAAGNISREHWADYPARNSTEGIHDPGQAWNALTVGAFTAKDWLDPAEFPAWEVIAPKGGLAPSSCTSQTWEVHGQLRSQWPLKPDVVMEGGNGALNAYGEADAVASLDLLTTHHQPLVHPFDRFGDTSAAAALAAGIAAEIQATYPAYWPETVRALVVHSAEWTDAMMKAHAPNGSKKEIRSLLRHCGFGVPLLQRALWSASNALTLVAQEELQPFDEFESVAAVGGTTRKVTTRDMHLHAIPWPQEILHELGSTEVELRVTLSYFIEPNPAARGWTRRYRYESHGLRFDVKRPTETVDQFRQRVNLYVREEEGGNPSQTADSKWLIGGRTRHLGSLHSDRWVGTAADLAERGYIAVYPALGWWRERKHLERWRKHARYSLVVSIATPDVPVDIYTAVAEKIAVKVPIPGE